MKINSCQKKKNHISWRKGQELKHGITCIYLPNLAVMIPAIRSHTEMSGVTSGGLDIVSLQEMPEDTSNIVDSVTTDECSDVL